MSDTDNTINTDEYKCYILTNILTSSAREHRQLEMVLQSIIKSSVYYKRLNDITGQV